MKEKYDVVIRYAGGVVRETTIRAKSEREAVELSKDAFFMEGECRMAVGTSAALSKK